MSVIQAGFLFGTLAVALPLVIHLLNRWQVRRIELGTMRFLTEVIRDGAQRRRIRRWLLLLTRMALVALISVLFARPFFFEPARRDGNRFRVILIDRSASMSMPGRQGRLVDDAVSEAIKRAGELGEDATIEWAWFDRTVQPITDGSTRLSAPKVVSGGTDYQAAIAYARDRVHANPTSAADVVLVTDLQQSGTREQIAIGTTAKFPADVPVHIVDVGRPAASNLAITNLATPSIRVPSGRKITLTATLFNFGSLPFEDVPLLATATQGTNTIRLKKMVQIPAGQAQEVEFELDKLAPGTWQLTVSLDVNDDLANDNVRYSAIEVTKPFDVFVIDRGLTEPERPQSHTFLLAALQQSTQRLDDLAQSRGEEIRSAGSDAPTMNHEPDVLDRTARIPGRFAAKRIDLETDGFPLVSADRLSLLVVANASNLNAADIDRLERFVNDGGRLLVFPGPPIGLTKDAGAARVSSSNWVELWNETDLAPGRFRKPQASGVAPFRITAHLTGTTMLEPFDDPQHGDLKRLSFHTILPVEPKSTTRVLAWFDVSIPAITQHGVGKGSVVYFLSSCDSSWSSWTMNPLYLPLVQQMSAELLNLNGEGPIRFRNVGDSIFTAQAGMDSSQRSPSIANSDNSSTKLVSMANKVNRSSEAKEKSGGLVVFDQAGFEPKSDVLFVVNSLASESDPTRITPEILADRYGLTLAAEEGKNIQSTVTATKRIELWPWLAAALIVFLTTEFALANRTAP